MGVVKRFMFTIFAVMIIIGMSFSNLAEDIDDGIFLIENGEVVETKERKFIEETKAGQSINDYERELLKRFMEESNSAETSERVETSREREVINQIKTKAEDFISKRIEKSEFDRSLNPKVTINVKHDKYEILVRKNTGTIKISDDKKVYYNNSANVKTIRDMDDEKGNSPMLLEISSEVKVFDFDESGDRYVLLPEGFVEDLIIKERNNKYLSPAGIKKLNHVKVDLAFNGTDLGKYDLYEYFVLYYLCCYEGVLGDYYYNWSLK